MADMLHALEAQLFELSVRLWTELDAQFEKWGEQNHPFISDGAAGVTAIRAHFAWEAEDEQNSNDWAAKNGKLDWRGILLEEVYEALAEENAKRAVTELIQVAAVAIQAAASTQRNGLDGGA